MQHDCHDPTPTPGPCCPEIPELQRLQYFYGQLLGSQDFRDEQSYFREKLKLLNRCLHGYGVVCGLEVTPVPTDQPCEPAADRLRDELEGRLKDLEARCKELEKLLAGAKNDEQRAKLEEQIAELLAAKETVLRRLAELCPPYDPDRDRPTRVVVDCGVAVDCEGHEIVLRRPHEVDLWRFLRPADRRAVEEGEAGSLYLSVCFCELPVEPVRPIGADTCSPPTGCRHAKIRDSYRLQVTTEKPPVDERCDPCCCACGEPCLLLARIDGFTPGRPLEPADVHNDVRRRIALHQWVTVTGVSWVHGGRYTDDQAAIVLGRHDPDGGLEFRFSRPVLTETLKEGVVEVWVIEGGKGRSAGLYNVAGEIAGLAPDATTDRLRFRQTSDETLQRGDRVLVRLRGDFILDECCRPVDGNHVGGRVPLLAGSGDHHPAPEIDACREAPGLHGPWRSGNGAGGGTFESWFFIHDNAPGSKK